ncbi:phosphatase PAP2 family protein [Streptomyces sp. MNU76]|uniref:bifunctional glycosyltransferase 87/phosphatase PAP2 family protein n=1 Tax=Streptomyces sp. MNU76 TaxID=2560026 RepID=UPI001E5B126C|nr:bifunctional glycosyltransferase 87/phosphatase PAP2 family protein [Streptomyces sp. MNU76]MCC9711530.1 phosphatase PAP2 family protein [Streptomyces sp. MNU76]
MANAEQSGRDEAIGTGRATGRWGTVRAVLWLVVAVLAVRQIAVALDTPNDEALMDLTRFTGTPFGGLDLNPLTSAAEQALGWGWTFGTLLLVVALGLVAARALPGPVTRRTALLAAPVAVALLMLSLPVRDTLYLGQTSVLPVLLVLVGCFLVRGERAGGVCVGLAAALQPTVLLFVVLLWLTDRRRAAASTAITFAGATALAWAALPHDSTTYWVHHLAGVGLGGRADDLANQSLHGALLRFGLTGPVEIAVFLTLAAAVAVFGMRRAVHYARDGQLLLAVAITGCVVVAVSPTSWQHQLLWVLLAVVGRVGKKASSRCLWPIAVVSVMTLPAKMMVPNVEILHPARDNVVLLAALACALVVPFLSRTSEYYGTPIPTQYAPKAETRLRWVPLLRRVATRPNLLLELLLIRVVYTAYQRTRLEATGSRASAEEHARQILSVEEALFLDVEHWFNHAVVGIGWLRVFFDFYYTSFHFVVPLTVLGLLYWRRPADYRWARTAIGFTTVLALVGFFLYPLAPPRLMPGLGIIDTIHGVQDFSRPDYGRLTELTNQYAAMPSLHFGWSLWCGLTIAIVAPRVWMKVLGLMHPFFTVLAIVATGNHWVLDAVGGAAVVGAGFGLTYLLTGPRAALGKNGRKADEGVPLTVVSGPPDPVRR